MSKKSSRNIKLPHQKISEISITPSKTWYKNSVSISLYNVINRSYEIRRKSFPMIEINYDGLSFHYLSAWIVGDLGLDSVSLTTPHRITRLVMDLDDFL